MARHAARFALFFNHMRTRYPGADWEIVDKRIAMFWTGARTRPAGRGCVILGDAMASAVSGDGEFVDHVKACAAAANFSLVFVRVHEK